MYLQQPWMDDVMAITQPWLLIAISKTIRNAALPFLQNIFSSSNSINAKMPKLIQQQNHLNKIG
jgi:hypothetical protein